MLSNNEPQGTSDGTNERCDSGGCRPLTLANIRLITFYTGLVDCPRFATDNTEVHTESQQRYP